MDGLEQQRYEEQVEEAARVADSYPRDAEQTAAAKWVDKVQGRWGVCYFDGGAVPCHKCHICREHYS